MTSQNRKPFVKGSRIRERDKKKAEYYVGDYFSPDIKSHTSANFFKMGAITLITFCGVLICLINFEFVT